MTYGPDGVARDMAKIRDDTASFEERAQLEYYIFTTLQERGIEAVTALLQSLTDHDFALVDDRTVEFETRYVSRRPDGQDIVVTIFAGPHSTSVNVTLADPAVVVPEPDPRHQAFYEVWESLLGLPDSAVAELDPKRQAVFLVGLLEAEVMNGGLGQYFANTDGVYLEPTVACLARIEAKKTRAILMAAAKLGAGAETWGAVWESKSEELERLDDAFLESGDDLAGLTTDVYF